MGQLAGGGARPIISRAPSGTTFVQNTGWYIGKTATSAMDVNQWGAWLEITASTTRNALLGLWIPYLNGQQTNNLLYGVQFGIGAAGSEVVVAEDEIYTSVYSGYGIAQPIALPVAPRIPLGSRLAARITNHSSGTSASLGLSVGIIYTDTLE